MKKKKKQPRSRPSKQAGKMVAGGKEKEEEGNEERKALNVLMEAFALTSIEEADSAYREANGDVNRAAEILGGLLEGSSSTTEDPSTSSSMSGSSYMGSSSSEVLMEVNAVSGKGFRGSKANRVVAATGTISTVLGKDYYARSSPRKESTTSNWVLKGKLDKDEAEQFLCSMLGDGSDLSMAVVKDVLCNCGYDVEKALDALLDLSTSSHELPGNDRSFNNCANSDEDTRLLVSNFTDRASDSTSHSSESELQDNVHYVGYPIRNYSMVVASSEAHLPTSPGNTESNLPQKVLESLFNVSESSSSAHEPSTMNWRNMVKKMQSLGQQFDYYPSGSQEDQNNYAKGDEYQAFRKSANQHWDSMRSYYQRAATAYSRGQREHATYLSEQGKLQTKMAQVADEKASQEIFKARNKSIENEITIDMHGQHVKQAMKLLKLHLLFGSQVASIQRLKVITGCGSHGLGKSKVKEAVTQLLEREGIEWIEANQGMLLIKLDGPREFGFLDSDDETE